MDTCAKPGYAYMMFPTPPPEPNKSIGKMSSSDGSEMDISSPSNSSTPSPCDGQLSVASSILPPPPITPPPPPPLRAQILTEQDKKRLAKRNFNAWNLLSGSKASKADKALFRKIAENEPEKYPRESWIMKFEPAPDTQFMLGPPVAPPSTRMASPRYPLRSGARPSTPTLPVPEPTIAYKQSSDVDVKESSEPIDMLVILDLNGTLLWRPNKSNSGRFQERKHLREFLQFLLGNFHVMVWSSAQPENVKLMTRNLFPDYITNPKFLDAWDREDFRLTPMQYYSKTQVYKNLEWVWGSKELQAQHPLAYVQGRWDQRNTILLDDSSLKAVAQPHNHIEVPEFEGTIRERQYDRVMGSVLEQVAGYLETVKSFENISAYMRQRPFRVNEGGHRYDLDPSYTNPQAPDYVPEQDRMSYDGPEKYWPINGWDG